MSIEIRKKSSSFTQSINPMKTIPKNQSKQGQLANCKSVSAFVDPFSHNTKSQITNRSKEIEKFSIENGRHYSAKKGYDQTKVQIKNNSFVGYKEAIEKKKKKGTQGKKNLAEELFMTIDTFQETLLSLPLQKLILSENPYYWVEEQVKTLQKLQEKFMKIINTLPTETKHYYQTKLQSISIMIKNMNENLNQLNGINLLKNYGSGGTSLQSRNSQSTSSLGQTSNLPFEMKETQTHKRSRYQTQTEDKINQGRNYATDFSSSQGQSSRNQENKENVMRYSNDITLKPKVKNIDTKKFSKVEINQKDQFFLKEYKSSNSNSVNQGIIDRIKTLRSSNSISDDEQKHFKLNQKRNLNQFVSRETQNQKNLSYEQNISFFKKKNMNQTVSKYNKNTNQDATQMIDHLRKFTQNESKQTFNTLQNQHYGMESMDCGEETKRRNVLRMNQNSYEVNQQLNELRTQLQTKNRIIIHLQGKHQHLVKQLQEQFAKKEHHYVQTIYELQEENNEKQESIKQLLLERQAGNDQIDLTKRQLASRVETNNKLTQKLTLFEQSAQTLTNQLRKSKIREDQLRETVQLERQRTKKLQKQIEQTESQMDQMKTNLKALSNQNSSKTTENEKLSKQLSLLIDEKQKMKEKQEIYKLKYFKLYAEFDKFKQKVNEDSEYWKKICLSCKKQYTNPQNTDPEKQTELRELISFHKKRLLCE